jgi:hypothetical protein
VALYNISYKLKALKKPRSNIPPSTRGIKTDYIIKDIID